jgi:hypothetical protein
MKKKKTYDENKTNHRRENTERVQTDGTTPTGNKSCKPMEGTFTAPICKCVGG